MEPKTSRQLPRWLPKFFLHPAFLLCAAAVLLSAITFSILYFTRTVYIQDGDRTIVALTMEQDVRKLLDQEDIPFTSNDLIENTSDGLFQTLTITRSFPVELVVDGASTTYHVLGGTLGQLLVGNGISIGPLDTVSHPNHHRLSPGDQVLITRVESRTRVETMAVRRDIVYKPTSVIGPGRYRTLQEGSDGVLHYTFEDIIEDGEVVDSVLVATNLAVKPTESVVLVGDGSPISILDYSSEFPLDEFGNPTKYSVVLRGQPATGYSARPGAYGAAVFSPAKNHPDVGTCVPGTVAINPNLIPYGTRMYIKTPDGKFVYGYAIANDTGQGMMDGTITVDLFYDTYLESALNSLRYVDIYILD